MQCITAPIRVLGNMVASLRPATVEERTETTLLKIKKNIDNLNLKIMQLQGEKKMIDDKFEALLDQCNNNPDESEQDDLKKLLWRAKRLTESIASHRNRLQLAQKDEATVQEFLMQSDSTIATDEIQKNIEYLTKRFNPQQMHKVLDKQQERITELGTFNKEIDGRVDASRTRDMDVDNELQRKINARTDAVMLQMPDIKSKMRRPSAIDHNINPSTPGYVKQHQVMEMYVARQKARRGNDNDDDDDNSSTYTNDRRPLIRRNSIDSMYDDYA